MKIIGRTVQVTHEGDARATQDGGKSDHGRTATVVGWTYQPDAPKADRWLVLARLDDGQIVNYRTSELAFEDGSPPPRLPDIEEV